MASEMYSTNIAQLQREIERSQRELAGLNKDEASKSKRISDIQRSITKNTSQSIYSSKLRDIQRLQDEIARLQGKRAAVSKKIADKTAKLHSYQNRQADAQLKAQQDMFEAMKKSERIRNDELASGLARLHTQVAPSLATLPQNAAPAKIYDVFISHASEDKAEFATVLAQKLQASGVKVWFDEFELKLGDSLRRSIDKGLVASRFGIIVLSSAFFAKNWTQYELDGLVAREMEGAKVILPIWHKVSKDEVMNYSPSLADKFALNTSEYTIDELVSQIVEVVSPGK